VRRGNLLRAAGAWRFWHFLCGLHWIMAGFAAGELFLSFSGIPGPV